MFFPKLRVTFDCRSVLQGTFNSQNPFKTLHMAHIRRHFVLPFYCLLTRNTSWSSFCLEIRWSVQDNTLLSKIIDGLVTCPELLGLVSCRTPSDKRSRELFAKTHHRLQDELRRTTVRTLRQVNLPPPEVGLLSKSRHT